MGTWIARKEEYLSTRLIDLPEADRPMGHSARQSPDGWLPHHPALQQPGVPDRVRGAEVVARAPAGRGWLQASRFAV